MKKKCLSMVLLVLGIYITFRFLLPLVLPFVGAGIVAVVYYPFLRKTYQNTAVWQGRKKRWFLTGAVCLLYLLLFVGVAAVCLGVFGQGQSILLNFPFYEARVVCFLKNCCGQIDGFLQVEDGVSFAYIENMAGAVWGDSFSTILSKITSYSVQAAGRIFGVVFRFTVMVMATFFIMQDYEGIRENMIHSEPGKYLCGMIVKCRDTLKAYLQAQGVIMLLDGTLCTVAFFMIRQPYFLVLGPAVAVVDALPVFGAGFILIPYGLMLLFLKEFGKAGVIFAAYAGCFLIRQITEPKMIGSKMGLSPLVTIMSMYVGYRLFGIFGFVLGPVGVMMVMQMWEIVSDNIENSTKNDGLR